MQKNYDVYVPFVQQSYNVYTKNIKHTYEWFQKIYQSICIHRAQTLIQFFMCSLKFMNF